MNRVLESTTDVGTVNEGLELEFRDVNSKLSSSKRGCIYAIKHFPASVERFNSVEKMLEVKRTGTDSPRKTRAIAEL